MIAKIIFGMSTKNSIYYNEKKVKQSKAFELQPFKTIVPTNLIKDKIDLMEIYSKKNENVKNNSTHIVLSFTNEDSKKGVDFRLVTKDYLNELGYGQQPAFIYYHNDTSNPHIHIVTTPIKSNGEKISDQYIYLKSNNIRKKMELKYNLKVAETSEISKSENIGSEFTKQKMQTVIKNAMNFKYSAFEDYANYLSTQGVNVITKKFLSKTGENTTGLLYQLKDKKPIKASSFYFKPTYENIIQQVNPSFLEDFQLELKTEAANNSINSFLNPNKIEVLKYKRGYFLKDLKNKFIIDSTKTGIDNSIFENYFNIQNNSDLFKKHINILISRLYQNFKKENGVHFESDLIQNFPADEIISHLNTKHNVDRNLAKELVEAFHKFKLKLLHEIKSKEIGYFRTQSNKIIDFIDNINLNKSDKFKLLAQLDIQFIKATNLVFHTKNFEINFERKSTFKENNVPNIIPDNLNMHTIKLLKKMALSEKPNKIFINAAQIDSNILILLSKKNLIQSANGVSSINSEYQSILNADSVEYENEKFLGQNHKNYTKTLRGF